MADQPGKDPGKLPSTGFLRSLLLLPVVLVVVFLLLLAWFANWQLTLLGLVIFVIVRIQRHRMRRGGGDR
jgi:hypothetical protein